MKLTSIFNLVNFSILVLAISQGTAKDYFGHKLINLEITNESVLKKVQSLIHNSRDIVELEPVTTSKRNKMVISPEIEENFVSLMKLNNIKHQILLEDVGRHFEENDRNRVVRDRSNDYEMNWDDYQSYQVISDFVDALASKYDFVSNVSIGQTIEGRETKLIKISRAPPGAPNVFIDAGIHAREWISPAVTTYIIRELVEFDSLHPQYVDNLNIHIIPVTNPDGYEFSRSDDRLWRKNRRAFENRECLGVDLNRNFDSNFGGSGTLKIKCSDIYLGEHAFSEPETENLRKYFKNLDPVPELALSMHSAADMLIYPYGYAHGVFPSNVDEIHDLGVRAMDALYEVNQYKFITGNSATLLGLAAGASDDWYKDEGVRFTYTAELRNDGYLFNLPPKYIVPSGEEFWAAMEVFLNEIIPEQEK